MAKFLLLGIFALLHVTLPSAMGDDTAADAPPEDEEVNCSEQVDECRYWMNETDFRRFSKSPFAIGSLETLETNCGKFSGAKECVALLAGCPAEKAEFVKENWPGIESVFDYVCDSGKQAFGANSVCWSNAAVQSEVNKCETVENSASKNSDAEKCRAQNGGAECNIDAVKKGCSKEAVSVMKHFQVLRRKPIVSAFSNCKLARDNNNWDESGVHTSSLSLVTSSFLTLVLLAMAALLSTL